DFSGVSSAIIIHFQVDINMCQCQLECGQDSMPIVVEHSSSANGLPFRFRSAESLVSDFRIPGHI
ncbi:hypothetical protein ACFL6S_37835, partial [Candidatus Poribacteria bacterium]